VWVKYGRALEFHAGENDRLTNVAAIPCVAKESRSGRRDELSAAPSEFVTARGKGSGSSSVPGSPDLRLEALPDSTRPAELRRLGYTVERIGETQRILPHARSPSA
jgi:hypothetical protein